MTHSSVGLQGLVAASVFDLLSAATCPLANWEPSEQAIHRLTLNHGSVGHSSYKNTTKVFLDYLYNSANTEKSQAKT